MTARLQDAFPAMRALALSDPLDAGGNAAPTSHRVVFQAGPSGQLAGVLILTTEICGCLGPSWHASASLRHVRNGPCDAEDWADEHCRQLLTGVGIEARELWWWNPDARVGHLRVRLTRGEELRQGHVRAELPDDHEEPGVWRDRQPSSALREAP